MERVPTKRFQVHLYRTVGEPPGVLDFDLEVQARGCAQRHFELKLVYKAKVWDTVKGPVIPDTPVAAGLILYLTQTL